MRECGFLDMGNLFPYIKVKMRTNYFLASFWPPTSRLGDFWNVELEEDESTFIVDTLDIHNKEPTREYAQKYIC